MSIKTIIENGHVKHKINIKVESRTTGKNVQKQMTIKKETSRKDLLKFEQRLRDEANRELIRRENQGSLWKHHLELYEMALHKGEGPSGHVQRTTIQDNIGILELYTKKWMNRPTSSINRADVKAVMNEIRKKGLSVSRTQTFKNAVNGLFTWAIDNNKIIGVTHSPAHGIRIDRGIETKKPEILTLTEIKELLSKAHSLSSDWKHIWSMALLTGMRSGELYALTWNDIDFEYMRIAVSKSYNSRMKVIKSTKSGDWREVPISSQLEKLLKELKLMSANEQYVLPRITKWRRGEAARELRKFCEGIGITSIKFHVLRACFATQLLRDGVAPAIVMKICGWKDLKTMQRYIRLAGIEIEGATENLKFLPETQVMGRVVKMFT
jgi:integrase